jgi:hypothetical protein
MSIEAGTKRRMPVFLAGMAGECHQPGPHRHIRKTRPDGVRHHETIQARQSDIEQHHVGSELVELRQGAGTVVRHFDLVIVESQQLSQGLGGIAAVLDHEHAPPGNGSRNFSRLVRCGENYGRDPRQLCPEFAALAQSFTVRLDTAAMHFDQVLDDRKSDAETAL